MALSPTAVGELLKAEGFAPLPRRLDEERPERVRPTVEPVADVRSFSLEPHSFATRYGGLFLFVSDLVRLGVDGAPPVQVERGSQTRGARSARWRSTTVE